MSKRSFLRNFQRAPHPEDGSPCLTKELNTQENDICSILRSTPLAAFVPEYYGSFVVDGQEVMVWQDFSQYENYAELRVGDHDYPLFEEEAENQAIGTSLTDSVRLVQAQVTKRRQIKRWTADTGEAMSTGELKSFLKMFLEGREAQMRQRLTELMAQYGKMGDGFRMYSGSLFIAYNNKGEDVVVYLLNHGLTYIDIETNGCQSEDVGTEDGVMEGLVFLSEALDQSRCCIIL